MVKQSSVKWSLHNLFDALGTQLSHLTAQIHFSLNLGMFFSHLALQSIDTHVSGIVKVFVKKKYCQAKEIDFVTLKKQLPPPPKTKTPKKNFEK